MNFTCTECNDTGSRDKLGTYLDCNACGTAATRRDLNDFVKSLGPTHPEDVALAIHQRALAMAPKQEAPEPVAQDCGACLGTGWVSRDADIGTEQECFSCDGSGKSDDAAPAAANGALTDEQVHQGVMALLGCTSSEVEDYSAKLYEGYANDVRRVHSALAAAGHDAALPDGYVMAPLKPTHAMIKAMAESRATDDEGVFPAMLDLLDFSGENKTHTVLEAAYVAALSGAKGN